MPLNPLKVWPGRRVKRVPATRHPAGYFGKVPTHGDFVSNRLDRAFREAFDGWLRGSIRASQERLGDGWLNAFLASPVWRFALAGGIAGRAPVLGVLAPSADRVGRYFPLVVAVPLPEFRGPPEALAECRDWLAAADAAARSAAGPDFTLAAFDKAVEAIAPPLVREDVAQSEAGGGLSFWWTGDDAPERGAKGFPPPDAFAALLGARAPAPRTRRTEPEPPPPRAPLAATAATATHASARRAVNADASFVAPAGDLFAVADGIGDDRASAAAALAAADSLREVNEPFALPDLVADAKGKLGKVHARLRAAGGDAARGPQASVVVLALKGDRFAVLWAGDARCYLRHAGTLRLVTQDHVEVGLRRAVSRGVGAPGPLAIQVADGVIEDGDRFILVSNATVRATAARDLAELVASGTPAQTAHALVEDALIAGVADNVTAVVVDVATLCA